MNTVLGPGLGEGLQLDIRGLTALCTVMSLDGLHLRQVQGEDPLSADLQEGLVVGRGDGDRHQFERPALPGGEHPDGFVSMQDILDHLVRQRLRGQ